jgi:hypothetical protein
VNPVCGYLQLIFSVEKIKIIEVVEIKLPKERKPRGFPVYRPT